MGPGALTTLDYLTDEKERRKHMGCDIHLHVERKTEGTWEQVPPPKGWSERDLAVVDREIESWEGDWFGDRNYALFAWLADVRNSHGNPPLAPERGLPSDVSAKVKEESDGWDGGHSHSWFTVAELMAGLESLVVKHAGLVKEDVYNKWKASGESFPEEWCQGSSAPAITEAEYRQGVRPELRPALAWAGFYVRCAWEVTGKESFVRFVKLLGELTKLGTPDDVRIVFWFDN